MSNYFLQQLINQGVPVNFDDIMFLDSAVTYADKLIETIDQAQTRVLLNMLYLERDESGEKVLDHLIAKKIANPSLEIKVVVDFYRSCRLRFGDSEGITNQQWYKNKLEQLNNDLVTDGHSSVDVYGMQINTSELLGVYHIKGHVIDDKIFYTGASVNNIYFGLKTYRQDRYQIINSSKLAQDFYNFTVKYFTSEHSILLTSELPDISKRQLKLQAKKYRRLVLSKPINAMDTDIEVNQFINSKYSSNNPVIANQLTATLIYGLGKKNNLLTQSILALLDQVKEEVLIYTPYFNPTLKLKRQFKRLMDSGKKVILVLGDKTANDFYVPEGSRSYHRSQALPYLYEINLQSYLRKNQWYLDQGLLEIRLWKNDRNTYHVKGIRVDSSYYLLTGHNLNPRGFYADAENAILLSDPHGELKTQIQVEQDYLLKNTKRLISYKEIDRLLNYPTKVKRTLKRYRLFLLDYLAKFLL